MSSESKPQTPRRRASDGENFVQSMVTEFAAEKERERSQEAERRRPSRVRRFVFPAVAGLACLAAWFVPVPIPDHALPVAPEYAAASARMTLVLASRRLEAFRRQYRRLPSTLDDAGIGVTHLEYRTGSDSFELKLPVEGSYVTLHSGEAPAKLPQDALSIIRRTAK